MSMIKGKIETSREMAPKRIIGSENSPFRRVEGEWVHSAGRSDIVKVKDAQSVAKAADTYRKNNK